MSIPGRAERAAGEARERARGEPESAPPDGRPRRRTFAIGDPQAPLEKFLAILDHRGLLDERGRLAGDVRLVSMGDHFDWGPKEARRAAAEDGLAIVAWLASHPADQAILLLGNHDLARVGELSGFDDARFERAQAEADRAYLDGEPGRPEADFRKAFDLPSWEVASRDFGTYRAEQRRWVAALLGEGRFLPAYAAGSRLLLVHAGLTSRDVERLGEEPGADAPTIAWAFARALDEALARARAEAPSPDELRVVLPGLHEPGGAGGEGRGVFFHRASLEAPSDPNEAGRRFDPRQLPRGLLQAIGHVRDKKSRQLLGEAIAGPVELARRGRIRHLETDGRALRYAPGAPPSASPSTAVMAFLDGEMLAAEPAEYEMLDCATLRAF